MAEAPKKKKTRRKKKKKKKNTATEGGAEASMWGPAVPARHIAFGMPAGAESSLDSDDMLCPPGCVCYWCSWPDGTDDFSVERWDEERRDNLTL